MGTKEKKRDAADAAENQQLRGNCHIPSLRRIDPSVQESFRKAATIRVRFALCASERFRQEDEPFDKMLSSRGLRYALPILSTIPTNTTPTHQLSEDRFLAI